MLNSELPVHAASEIYDKLKSRLNNSFEKVTDANIKRRSKANCQFAVARNLESLKRTVQHPVNRKPYDAK